MHIEGKKVRLRAIEHYDLEQLNQWSNSPELWQRLTRRHFPYSHVSTSKWFDASDNSNSEHQILAIETLDKELIGTTNQLDINRKNGNAVNGMMLGNPKSRGQGLGLDTLMSIMRYAFNVLGFYRLDTGIIKSNTASLAFYTQKCGWEIEGVRPKWHFRNN